MPKPRDSELREHGCGRLPDVGVIASQQVPRDPVGVDESMVPLLQQRNADPRPLDSLGQERTFKQWCRTSSACRTHNRAVVLRHAGNPPAIPGQ